MSGVVTVVTAVSITARGNWDYISYMSLKTEGACCFFLLWLKKMKVILCFFTGAVGTCSAIG